MKNIDLLNLSRIDILGLTTHTLSTEAAYKVFKFKKAIREAYAKLSEAEKALFAEVGIEPETFDKDRAELRKKESLTEEEKAKLAEMDAAAQKFFEMRAALYDEEIDFPVQTIAYKDWKALQDENCKNGLDPLSGFAEEALENILWSCDENI